jgi:hypothetical protein
MTADIYRDGLIHVLDEKCATCIFKPGVRPVDGARVAQMVRDTKDDPGATIPCHSTLYRPDKQENAICRGWYDRFADADPIISMAKAMDIITYDPVPDDSVWPKPQESK